MQLLPALSVGTLLACLAVIAFVMLHNLDRGLEAPVLEDPRPSLRHQLRELLGVHDILTHLHRMEKLMATATEQLNNLSSKVDDLISDVRAALATINNDDLSAEAQTALDGLTAKIDAFDAEVGDADGSDGTVPEQPADENA